MRTRFWQNRADADLAHPAAGPGYGIGAGNVLHVVHRPTPDTVPALRLSGVDKAYGAAVAVDRLDLEVPAGSCCGLVGPPDAGKTTTLLLAAGLARPDAGKIAVYGVDMWAEPVAAKAMLGVLPDGPALPDRLTVRELLGYTGLMRGLAPEFIERRTGELLGVLGLARVEHRLIGDCPPVVRTKVGLATALLHDPRLLLLDEPFEAVDPLSAATMSAVLRRYVARGGSVLLSSRRTAPVEEHCDRVVLLADGRVVGAGPLAEIRAGGGLDRALAAAAGTPAGGEEALRWLSS